MDEHTRDPTVGPPASGAPTAWCPGDALWAHDTLRGAAGHGVRLFNAGAYHETHDRFENVWSSVNNSYRQGSGVKPPATTL